MQREEEQPESCGASSRELRRAGTSHREIAGGESDRTARYGDNLAILRDHDGSVDLIYLDPPFSSSLSNGRTSRTAASLALGRLGEERVQVHASV